MSEDKETLRRALRGLGFDVVKFTAAPPDAAAPGSSAFAEWLAAGNQADMAWLDRSLPKRVDANQVLDGVKSVILLGVNYHREAPSEPERAASDSSTARRPIWARYAQNLDYHDTMKPGLAAAGAVVQHWAGISDRDYRYYVDTGPVLERSWAAKAGVGFIGKNAMLISRNFGNWLFLAAVLVRVEIEPDASVSPAVAAKPIGTLCGKCTACLDACPTGALPAPGVLDARRCISYQTIENKGIIPRELRAGIGNRIYGCDICAEVCPWNRFAQEARTGLLEARPAMANLNLSALLRLTPEGFAATFKGTAIKRLKLRGLLRNACVVAGNEKAVECLPDLWNLMTHPEPMVRAHAVWAVREIDPDGELGAWRERETDAAVRAEYDAATG